MLHGGAPLALSNRCKLPKDEWPEARCTRPQHLLFDQFQLAACWWFFWKRGSAKGKNFGGHFPQLLSDLTLIDIELWFLVAIDPRRIVQEVLLNVLGK